MPASNAELVRRWFELLGGSDPDAVLDHSDEDLVIDRRNAIGPFRGIARGREEALAAYRDFFAAFETTVFETLSVRELGRGIVVTETRFIGRGRMSGIDTSVLGGWMVVVRGGRIVEAVLHQTYPEALYAARRRRLAESRLYFVCEARPRDTDPAPLLEAALRGGVDLIQLRDKALRDDGIVESSRTFRTAADAHGALFVLNDRPDLVAACEADGVHVGQEDMPVAEARALAGVGALIGLSTHAVHEVEAAFAATGGDRPDQVSVGPVWATPTKEGRPATGLPLIQHAARIRTDVAWFAIGGIDRSNLADVLAAGARRIVVVRAIRDAADPEAAARELRAALD